MSRSLVHKIAALLMVSFVAAIPTISAQETVYPEQVFGLGFTSGAVLSPGGTKALLAHGSVASLFDIESGATLVLFSGHCDRVQSVAFSPDGGRVLTGSDDDTAKLWNASTGRLIRTFSGHTVGVRAVTFSPDGSKVLTGSADRTAKLWDADGGADEVRV
jgi:WD40 repeat protein